MRYSKRLVVSLFALLVGITLNNGCRNKQAVMSNLDNGELIYSDEFLLVKSNIRGYYELYKIHPKFEVLKEFKVKGDSMIPTPRNLEFVNKDTSAKLTRAVVLEEVLAKYELSKFSQPQKNKITAKYLTSNINDTTIRIGDSLVKSEVHLVALFFNGTNVGSIKIFGDNNGVIDCSNLRVFKLDNNIKIVYGKLVSTISLNQYDKYFVGHQFAVLRRMQ